MNLGDVELKVEPGYYSGAYIDIDNENSLNYCEDNVKEEQIKRINDFLEALRKEFGLTKLGVAWGPASNGETGYKILNDALEENCKVDEAKEIYEIEYWYDEDARDQGLGDIAIETFDNLEDAKAYADKLFGEVASVEVLDSKGNVVYGRYPEDESLKESNLNEGHQGFTYKGYDIDWNDDDLDLENGIDGLNIVIRVGNKDGKEVATVKSYKEAREWCDKHPLYTPEDMAKAFANALSNQLKGNERISAYDSEHSNYAWEENEVEINVDDEGSIDGYYSWYVIFNKDGSITLELVGNDEDGEDYQNQNYKSLGDWLENSPAGMFLSGECDMKKVLDDTFKALGIKEESLKEDANEIKEAPENPSTHLGYKESGEEVIKQVGHAYLLKKGNRYIVRYAPGYYVNDIKANSDEEAINKFMGLEESLTKLAERKSKKKLKFRYTGDPAKDAEFFNKCQGFIGDDGSQTTGEVSSVSLGEEEVKESLDDYYVVSDGKDPRHSYVFSENGRETALNMLKDYKGNGYWEVLHYVKGNPIMIYNTRDGAIEEK